MDLKNFKQLQEEVAQILGESLDEASSEKNFHKSLPAPLAKNKRIKKLLAKAGRPGIETRLHKLHKDIENASSKADRDHSDSQMQKLVDRLKKHADKKDEGDKDDKRKSKRAHHVAKASGGGDRPGAASKANGGNARGGGVHHPFKRRANLGPGPKGKHHDQTKYWKCSCPDGAYKKCICKGKKGETKKITIKKDYHRAYNRIYHKWRAGQGGAVTGRLGGKAHG
jgi:hypothetical protein